ncbi:hypothetical protein J4457_04550 [Candidatus Woesearchaeota archaeon]|nr:hypothetical protein [Candidatus Woesearchaeota archaeon]
MTSPDVKLLSIVAFAAIILLIVLLLLKPTMQEQPKRTIVVHQSYPLQNVQQGDLVGQPYPADNNLNAVPSS